MCGRNARGKRTEPTGKFSPAALAATSASSTCPFCLNRVVPTEGLLPPESLSRYADAIVKASLVVEQGDTFVVMGEPEHRELLAAVATSAYKAGAQYVDVVTNDPLVQRAQLLCCEGDSLGALAPWTLRLLRQASSPKGASAFITGAGEAGYLDGVPPERIADNLFQR